MQLSNAAVMASEQTRVGPGGWESQFATGHLRHFAGMGGVYIERCDIAEIADPATDKGKQEGVNPDAIEPGAVRTAVGGKCRPHRGRRLRLRLTPRTA